MNKNYTFKRKKKKEEEDHSTFIYKFIANAHKHSPYIFDF